MRICMGGTFDPFHVGHEALLQEAASEATVLFVGVTEGHLAARAERKVASFATRAARVESFLRNEAGYSGELKVRALNDAAGPAATGDYDAIVVSAMTQSGAVRINEIRKKAGLKRLAVRVVAPVLGEDLLPVSATAVAAGRIDREGRRQRPVLIAVGSANAVKVEAVQAEIGRILGEVAIEVHGRVVASRVPEQPKGEETLRGAQNRARAAMDADPSADFAVGVEAGLIRMPGEQDVVDVQACVVLDRDGVTSVGWGPGFHYPAWVQKRALAGEMVSRILGPIVEDPRIGSTIGAVGYLSDGRMDRTRLTRQAVLMAMLPRIRADLYHVEPR